MPGRPMEISRGWISGGITGITSITIHSGLLPDSRNASTTELAAPVSHIWYFKGIPSRMGLILDLSPRVLEKVLYFASYIVLDDFC